MNINSVGIYQIKNLTLVGLVVDPMTASKGPLHTDQVEAGGEQANQRKTTVAATRLTGTLVHHSPSCWSAKRALSPDDVPPSKELPKA